MPEIVKTEDVLGGDPRIEGRRIGVYHVYQRYVEEDDTSEEIVTSYEISVAEIHAALAYAFSHPRGDAYHRGSEPVGVRGACGEPARA